MATTGLTKEEALFLNVGRLLEDEKQGKATRAEVDEACYEFNAAVDAWQLERAGEAP